MRKDEIEEVDTEMCLTDTGKDLAILKGNVNKITRL